MALETGTYISDLVAANPAHTDGLNQADSHLRLLKSTILATFPNIKGVINGSDTNFNTLVSQLSSGVSLLATNVGFQTNVYDGLSNPAQGTVDLVVTNAGNTTSQVVASYNSSGVSVTGNSTISGNETIAGTLGVTGAITGPGVNPIGACVIWFSDTLPTVGTWCWANGGTLSRTTYADLFSMWGTTYGAGDGTTTFNVPNMQEVVPVGKSTMGGGTSPGLLTSISTALKAVLNGTFGTDTTTLTAAQIPEIYTTSTNSPEVIVNSTVGNVVQGQVNGGNSGSGVGLTTLQDVAISSLESYGYVPEGITAQSYNTGGGAHNNVQPSRAVNYIIRIA